MTRSSVGMGLAAAALLVSVSACGSSGSPSSSGTPTGTSSSPTPTMSSSGIPAALNGFCGVFKQIDLAAIQQSRNVNDVAAAWDKATADAPGEIRGDMQVIDDYIHAAVNHDLQTMQVDAPKLSAAAAHLGVYSASHCSHS